MEKIPFSQARENLADLVNSVRFGHKRYALTRHGKQVAAIVSTEDLALLERVIEELEDYIDIKEGEKALQRAKEEGTVPFEQVIKDLDYELETIESSMPLKMVFVSFSSFELDIAKKSTTNLSKDFTRQLESLAHHQSG